MFYGHGQTIIIRYLTFDREFRFFRAGAIKHRLWKGAI